MKYFFVVVLKKEWRAVMLVAVCMVVITGAPYVYGYFSAPTGYTYTGLHALSPGDVPVYYSYINQVKRGEVFLRDLFTSESQASGLFNIWWLGVGNFARLSNMSAALAFHVARLIMVVVAVFCLYGWLSYFFTDTRWRMIALIFVLGSAGIGVYAAPFLVALDPASVVPGITITQGHWPIDLGIGEGTVFNALYQSSHFIASLLLLMALFGCVVVASSSPKIRWKFIVTAGILAFIECNFHPYYAPLIGGVLFVYWLGCSLQQRKILWHMLGGIIFVGACVVPSVSYHVWVLTTQPILAMRALQNITLLSEIPYIVFGYGFLLVGGTAGLCAMWRNGADRWWMMATSWLLVSLVLMFAPTQFQSRYVQGVQLLLSILTVRAAATWLPMVRNRWPIFDNKVLLVVLVVMMFGMTSLFQLARDVYYFQTPTIAEKKYIYMPNDVRSAINWLARQDAGAVLSAPINGSFVAAYTHHQVYIAHGHETINLWEKVAKARLVYSSTLSPSDLNIFLSTNNLGYVVYGALEKTLGQLDVAQYTFLHPVFSDGPTTVYRVVAE